MKQKEHTVVHSEPIVKLTQIVDTTNFADIMEDFELPLCKDDMDFALKTNQNFNLVKNGDKKIPRSEKEFEVLVAQ